MSDAAFLDTVLDATPQTPVVPQSNVVRADFSGVVKSGSIDVTASRQWASRPDDERYTSMKELDEFLTDRRIRSTVEDIKLSAIQPCFEDGGLKFRLPGVSKPVAATHYAFGDLCQRIQAPAAYLRRLPDRLAAECMTHGLDSSLVEQAKALIEWRDNVPTLRALTSGSYGRIWDSQLSAVMREQADRHGWQVPVAFQRPGMVHNKVVAENPTKESTTLYGSDRDTFMFLVDQQRPIEVGKLADGTPDRLFRGIYAFNGETGARTIGVGTFLYRFVCENRCIWGQAGLQKFVRRHTKLAPEAFISEIMPAIEGFMSGSSTGIEAGLLAAKEAKLGMDQDQQLSYLATMFNIGMKDGKDILDTILAEEDHPAESAWDIIQGVTASARKIPYAAERVERETMAGNFLAQFMPK